MPAALRRRSTSWSQHRVLAHAPPLLVPGENPTPLDWAAMASWRRFLLEDAAFGMAMPDLQLIHVDLKTENILLVSPDIRVPDYKY
ncbi:serine/threonine-protein kinase AFC2-like isoform X4 [Triticum dicoccoides]|uniref:serine/threonine-protein kinase AFC2-like isoform X4 n=1 Tax=Triticum dicoccoides TaxID=85692 RepID=UPI0018914187|nr:serine/threonine-protein kinase AFC2-like isoform X4 [Triticum dicoccoides]